MACGINVETLTGYLCWQLHTEALMLNRINEQSVDMFDQSVKIKGLHELQYLCPHPWSYQHKWTVWVSTFIFCPWSCQHLCLFCRTTCKFWHKHPKPLINNLLYIYILRYYFLPRFRKKSHWTKTLIAQKPRIFDKYFI